MWPGVQDMILEPSVHCGNFQSKINTVTKIAEFDKKLYRVSAPFFDMSSGRRVHKAHPIIQPHESMADIAASHPEYFAPPADLPEDGIWAKRIQAIRREFGTAGNSINLRTLESL